MRIPDKLVPEYKAEIRAKTASAAFVLSVIAVAIWPTSVWLDYLLWNHTEFLPALLQWRFGTWAVHLVYFGFLLVARKKGWLDRWPRPMAWGVISICLVYVTMVCLIVGGAETPYYAGATLLMLAVLVAMPWGLLEMALSMVALVAFFDGVMLTMDPGFEWMGFFMAQYFFASTAFIGLVWTYAGGRMRVQAFLDRKVIEEEKSRSEGLLLNILPCEVADELKATGRVEARHIDECTILFTDFVGFTRVAGRVGAAQLVQSLDAAFSCFDAIITRLKLEKLKTIGDAYMAAGGVLDEQPDHLLRCLLAGLEMLHALETDEFNSADGLPWRMRVGLHTGPVVAGVIGQKKFAYDLWGDTVNTASRLEALGQARSVNMTTSLYKQVERFFVGVDRGFVPVRGKGPLAMTRVTRLRPEYSADVDGFLPNDLFHEHSGAWLAGRAITRASVGAVVSAVEALPDVQHEAHRVLQALPELTHEDREILMTRADLVTYAHGQVLVEQGQGLKMMLLLLRGVVSVRTNRGGVAIEVGRLKAGDLVGEISFVSWEPASATVVAMEDVVALRLDLDWMAAVMRQHAQTAARLFHSLSMVLAQRVRETNARLFAWASQRDAVRIERSLRCGLATRAVPPELVCLLDTFRTDAQALEAEGCQTPEARQQVSALLDRFVADVQTVKMTAYPSDPAFPSDVSALILRETFHIFMSSGLLYRLFTKPIGVPLDHVAADRIHCQEPRGHSPLGRCVDAWLQESELVKAVRACQGRAHQVMVEGWQRRNGNGEPYRVAVLGTSTWPGVFDALEEVGNPRDIALTCFDGDITALSAFGARAAERRLDDRFTFVCEHVVDGMGVRARLRMPPQDLIILPALTEDAEDSVLVSLFDEVCECLRPRGVFVLGVPSLTPSARFVSDILCDWRPAVWDETRLRQILRQSAFFSTTSDLVVTMIPHALSFAILRGGV